MTLLLYSFKQRRYLWFFWFRTFIPLPSIFWTPFSGHAYEKRCCLITISPTPFSLCLKFSVITYKAIFFASHNRYSARTVSWCNVYIIYYLYIYISYKLGSIMLHGCKVEKTKRNHAVSEANTQPIVKVFKEIHQSKHVHSKQNKETRHMQRWK